LSASTCSKIRGLFKVLVVEPPAAEPASEPGHIAGDATNTELGPATTSTNTDLTQHDNESLSKDRLLSPDPEI